MPVLDDHHDLAHPVEGDTAWSESYYFNCYDPGTDAGFYSRVGVRPNEGTIDVGLSIWVPGGGVAHMGHVREQKEMIERDLPVGPVRYQLEEPMKRWHLTADGESTAGPVNHLRFSPRAAMLSPSRAETGMKIWASTPMLARKARYSRDT